VELVRGLDATAFRLERPLRLHRSSRLLSWTGI
jgi:hypothetical protein